MTPGQAAMHEALRLCELWAEQDKETFATKALQDRYEYRLKIIRGALMQGGDERCVHPWKSVIFLGVVRDTGVKAFKCEECGKEL